MNKMETLFYQIYESLPRQGPGDDETTKKAFVMLPGLPEHPNILDVGCGVGKQTRALARLTSGKIIALDNHFTFLKILKNRIDQNSFRAQIFPVVGDMGSLGFKPESFDLIWSEGAAYFIGFENALETWKPLIHPSGYLVISHIVWFSKNVPEEIQKYWSGEYPDINYFENHFREIESNGYGLIGYFPLSEESWWKNYYLPLEQKIAEIKDAARYSKTARAVYDSFRIEIDMFHTYSRHYGYGFFVLKKLN
jgi:ubiquinone/menaquinone biosynthesis C-methylase UbiE